MATDLPQVSSVGRPFSARSLSLLISNSFVTFSPLSNLVRDADSVLRPWFDRNSDSGSESADPDDSRGISLSPMAKPERLNFLSGKRAKRGKGRMERSMSDQAV